MGAVPVLVEMLVDGSWTDVTDDVRVQSGITNSHGRRDEGSSSADSAKCRLVLDNKDGKYSPRNPASPYYGLIGRNTQIRVAVEEGSTWLVTDTSISAPVSAPDSVALSITGDVSVRVEADCPGWVNGDNLAGIVAGKSTGTGNQRSYQLQTLATGEVALFWSNDGVVDLFRVSTVPLPSRSGRLALRADLDVNNGAGGHTVTFYTAPSISGPWSVLGAPVVTAGTTSVFNSTAVARVRSQVEGTKVYRAEIVNSGTATTVASPDFTVQTPGASSFVDAQGNTWTLAGTSELTNRRVRFSGEVSSFPSRWDVAGASVEVPIEAEGVTRRLSQGSSVLSSAFKRHVLSLGSAVTAYWPMEDDAGATEFGPAVGSSPLRFAPGLPDPEVGSSSLFPCSDDLPVFSGAKVSGDVVQTTSGQYLAMMLMHIPTGGTADQTPIIRLACTGGTVRTWEVRYGSSTDGTLTVYATDGSGEIVNQAVDFDFNDDRALVYLVVEQDGSDVNWEIGASSLEDPNWGGTFAGFAAGQTAGRVRRVEITGTVDVTLGHLIVTDDVSVRGSTDLYEAFRSWAGEAAADRFLRLCAEEGLSAVAYDGSVDSMPMGVQTSDSLLALLRQVEAADRGMLTDAVDRLGFDYTARAALYPDTAEYAPEITLSYVGEVAPPLDPTDDDQQVTNDVTVSRVGGSKARQTLDTGTLSTLPPPLGVGRYDTSVSVSVLDDSFLTGLAGWLLALGTVDESRFPSVCVDLAATPGLIESVTALRPGSRLTITDLPSWLPPDDVELIVLGWSEQIGYSTWTVTFNCAPASPYRVLHLDGGEGARLDSATTTLNEALDTTETGIDVRTPDTSAAWINSTSYPSMFPFDLIVGGEVVRVTAATTAVTGGGFHTQTFTVTRSVNGVVKSHSSGASIRLHKPNRWAL